MAHRRRVRNKHNNPSATLVVVVLLVLMGAAGLLAWLLLPAAQAEGERGTAHQVQQGPLQGVDVLRETQHDPAEFHYLLNGSPVFNKKGKQGSLYLENCDGNSGFMQVVYLLDGEEIYTSPMLPPNHSLTADDLDRVPEPGEYEAEALIYVYPSAEADEYIRCFEENITVTVG